MKPDFATQPIGKEPSNKNKTSITRTYLDASLFLITNSARHQGDYLQRREGEKNGTPRKRQRLDDGAKD